MNVRITLVQAYQIFDSRGCPTIECIAVLQDGRVVKASVPAGTSNSPFEAPYLYDGSDDLLFGGKAVLKACEQINTTLAAVLVGQELDVQALDMRLSKIKIDQYGRAIGANALLAASMLMVRAAASAQQMPLYQLLRQHVSENPLSVSSNMPLCIFNLINGGMHATNGLFVQECSIIPLGCSFIQEAVSCAMRVQIALKVVLDRMGYQYTSGIEGGYSPIMKTSGLEQGLEAFMLLCTAVQEAGFTSDQIGYAIDVAASTFYDQSQNVYHVQDQTITTHDLVAWYQTLFAQCDKMMVCEDPLAATDVQGWQQMYAIYGHETLITGDDLTATCADKIEDAIDHRLVNAVLVKPNQVGTVSAALQALSAAQNKQCQRVVSHRSGETADAFIADLAVAAQAEFFKAGPPIHVQRLVKYQRLMQIQQQLGGILVSKYWD